MPEKRETLEDVARREAETERERAEARQEYLKSAERLAKEMPEAFVEFCGMVREAVRGERAESGPRPSAGAAGGAGPRGPDRGGRRARRPRAGRAPAGRAAAAPAGSGPGGGGRRRRPPPASRPASP